MLTYFKKKRNFILPNTFFGQLFEGQKDEAFFG
jgi:hypothetical protein